jgi:uncharacterized RDD family membrane protein YckC
MTDKQFGGFWRRLFAYCIDKIILYLLSLILFLIGILALGLGGVSIERIAMTGVFPRGMGLFMIVYIFTAIITGMVYFIWFHGAGGRTPGKMLFGLRVIQVSGEKMTFGVAFLRCVGYIISGLFFCLGFVWIAFDGRKQGWHDKIAATLVIHEGTEAGADRQTSHRAAALVGVAETGQTAGEQKPGEQVA